MAQQYSHSIHMTYRSGSVVLPALLLQDRLSYFRMQFQYPTSKFRQIFLGHNLYVWNIKNTSLSRRKTEHSCFGRVRDSLNIGCHCWRNYVSATQEIFLSFFSGIEIKHTIKISLSNEGLGGIFKLCSVINGTERDVRRTRRKLYI